MARKRQREIALAVLAIALVATAVWLVSSGSAPAPAAGTPAASAPRADQQGREKSGVTEVDLGALQADRPEPEEGNRNPFRFRPKPPPAPTPAQIKQKQQAEAIAAGPVEPPPPPPPPRILLKFIGVIDQKDSKVGRMAILSDTRGVYYGRETEIIEGRYRIIRIGVESIELAYLDGRGRQTIRLTGQ